MFHLDKQIENDSFFIGNLNLSRLLLINNKTYPWVILVPRRENMAEIIDLSVDDRICLMEEISQISNIMKEVFKPYKLNIASFGNVVRQLHIHIIARNQNDPSWPSPVWVNLNKEDYDDEARDKIINSIKSKI